MIGSVLIPGAKAPKLVSNDDLVARMKPGSVLVDIAVDQGAALRTAVLRRTNPPLSQCTTSCFTALPTAWGGSKHFHVRPHQRHAPVCCRLGKLGRPERSRDGFISGLRFECSRRQSSQQSVSDAPGLELTPWRSWSSPPSPPAARLALGNRSGQGGAIRIAVKTRSRKGARGATQYVDLCFDSYIPSG